MNTRDIPYITKGSAHVLLRQRSDLISTYYGIEDWILLFIGATVIEQTCVSTLAPSARTSYGQSCRCALYREPAGRPGSDQSAMTGSTRGLSWGWARATTASAECPDIYFRCCWCSGGKSSSWMQSLAAWRDTLEGIELTERRRHLRKGCLWGPESSLASERGRHLLGQQSSLLVDPEKIRMLLQISWFIVGYWPKMETKIIRL